MGQCMLCYEALCCSTCYNYQGYFWGRNRRVTSTTFYQQNRGFSRRFPSAFQVCFFFFFLFMMVFHACSVTSVWLFCDPLDCSPTGSSVRGIFQARILEWIAMPSSWPRDWTCISWVFCIASRSFTSEPLGKPFHLFYTYVSLAKVITLSPCGSRLAGKSENVTILFGLFH